jgi:hypothetical protein
VSVEAIVVTMPPNWRRFQRQVSVVSAGSVCVSDRVRPGLDHLEVAARAEGRARTGDHDRPQHGIGRELDEARLG